MTISVMTANISSYPISTITRERTCFILPIRDFFCCYIFTRL